MHQKTDLLISDLLRLNNDSDCHIIHWNSYEVSKLDGIFSIPHLVEENADYLKSKYLSLIYDFGEAKINEKRVIDHLLIRQNFSYWWMTLFVEKCNFIKSPQIDNIIKIMALELWLKENQYHKIKLLSSNEHLANSILQLSEILSIDFEWEKQQNKKPHNSLPRRFFHSLPNIFKSPIWLLTYVFSNWVLRGEGVDLWRKSNATTTFVSYFFNLVPNAVKEGRYESRYWTKLNDLLDDKNHSSNWLHIYVRDGILTSSRKARNFIRQLNSSQIDHQVHVTLASFLSAKVILLTLKDWLKVQKLNKLVNTKLKETSGYLWPLFIKDSQDSMSGIPAMNNLLDFNLFERAMFELPAQERGCYLQENMGWEFGFISAWEAACHKENLIGYPVSSIIYWDLRRFFDPRSYERKMSGRLPLPNYVGVNGEVSKNMYLSGGYPQENLIEVESLRYLYLYNFSTKKDKSSLNLLKEKVVLIAGDYSKEKTFEQLALLSNAFDDIDILTRFIFKPHPACLIKLEDFPGLSVELSTKPIEELLKISNVIYTSLITSAAIDGYCMNLPVITILNGATLNMSPLRGVKSVYFVKNSSDLSSAINTIETAYLDAKVNYFYLDPSLPRWQKWLNDDFDKNNK